LVAEDGPLNGTLKVTTIVELDPGFSTVLLVQDALATLQFHVEPPFSPMSVSPAGTVSDTVIGPEVGPALAPFATVTSKTAFWPCMNVPAAVSVIVRAGGLVLVREKPAAGETPATLAVTEYAPAVEFAVNVSAVATPDVLLVVV
jgi:hypothetical protein